nr:hypothetical protein [Angustibacter aerolatus]
MTALGSLGIDDDAERLYRQALRHDGSTLDEHVDRLGWTPERTRAALAPLLQAQARARGRRRAADRAAPADGADPAARARAGACRPAAPRAWRTSPRWSATTRPTTSPAAPTPSTRPRSTPCPPSLVAPTVEEVLRSTSGVIRSCHLEVGAGPAADAGVDRDARRLVARGREPALGLPRRRARPRGAAGVGARLGGGRRAAARRRAGARGVHRVRHRGGDRRTGVGAAGVERRPAADAAARGGLHRRVRRRLAQRPAGARRGARAGRRDAAARAAGHRLQGRGHRPLPRPRAAHRAAPGRRPDGRARRAHAVPGWVRWPSAAGCCAAAPTSRQPGRGVGPRARVR